MGQTKLELAQIGLLQGSNSNFTTSIYSLGSTPREYSVTVKLFLDMVYSLPSLNVTTRVS